MARWLYWVNNPIDPYSQGCVPVTTMKLWKWHWSFAKEPLVALCDNRWRVMDQEAVSEVSDIKITELQPCRPCLRSQKLLEAKQNGYNAVHG